MSVYMVDRDLPGITMEQLAAAQHAAIATTEQFNAEGKDVRYLRSVYVPSEHASSEEGLHIPLILLTVFWRFLALLIGCRCPTILAL